MIWGWQCNAHMPAKLFYAHLLTKTTPGLGISMLVMPEGAF